MNMDARRQYLKVLQERYFMAKSRKDKSSILDEYSRNTHQNRKYAIRRIRSFSSAPKERRKRKQTYDGYVRTALAKLWEIFDYPCGQRLAPLLKTEVSRLRQLEEIFISNGVAEKLKRISSATIDRALKRQREALHLKRNRARPKPSSLLYKRIPIRLTEWDTSKVGFLEIDLVIHCGSSAHDLYISSLNTVEISSGWWEAEAIMGKGQDPTFKALKKIRKRTPFAWKGVDSDNGPEFINYHLINYCEEENLEFTLSRPNKKNDNAYIEQKNWTHVRKTVGYLRYDTDKELRLMNSLYDNELRLYKNFFSPVMKLVSKERIAGKVKTKYDIPKTPYQRLMESGQISEEIKKELKIIYRSLNPAELKRKIEEKTHSLYRAYEEKNRTTEANPSKKQRPRSVTNYMIQQSQIGLRG
ncbi:MAG: transposase [Clostridia bacterium]|jgi:hypothetical protein|nr:transposase [Clostridia bacterium]